MIVMSLVRPADRPGSNGEQMTLSIKDALAARGVAPTVDELKKIESKWSEIVALKGDLDIIAIDDADISLRNIPGGDHIG